MAFHIRDYDNLCYPTTGPLGKISTYFWWNDISAKF